MGDPDTGGRVCTVGCTAWSAQSRQAEMGLSKAQEQQAVANAKNEIAAFSDMYNRMVKQCFEKCVESFHDKELTLGENTCLDRCVNKYVEAQQKVGPTMQKITKEMTGV